MSFSPRSLSHFGSSHLSWLSDNLLSHDDIDLLESPSTSSDDDSPEAQIDRSLARLNIVCPEEETAEERKERMSENERWDRWVLFGYTCVAAAAIISSVIAMATSTLSYLEIAFAFPLLTGPTIIHQREGIIKCRKKREWIGNLRNKTMRMKKANNELEAEIDLMEKEVERLKRVKKKLASIVEKQGQDVGVFMALANENAKINATKKQMAEATAFQTLITSVLKSDPNGDRFIGDAELNLLAKRLECIEGVPFTAKELCDSFSRWSTRNMTTLVDVVRTLYVVKRREQVRAKARKEIDMSPRNLGGHLLWQRKLDYGGVRVV